MHSASLPLNLDLLRHIPILCENEIVPDRELGRGGFCTVNVIRRIKLDTSCEEGPQADCRLKLEGKLTSYEETYFPNRIVALAGGPKPEETGQEKNLYKPPRVCLKRILPELKDRRLRAAILDLKAEVELLALLGKDDPHPNIIALHAVGLDDTCKNVSFIVLDQLTSTLNNKLYKWREAQGLGIMISRKKMDDLWLERMLVVMRVSSAVAFLHKEGVVHRDVTSNNIGFDSDGTVKLFDFGLAVRKCDYEEVARDEDKEARSGNSNNQGDSANTTKKDQDNSANTTKKDEGNNDDTIYDMSGQTGTPRYMAPEVWLEQPYGAKADVYSLSIVMYEILSLHKAYVNVSMSAFDSVVIDDDLRPTLDANWPLSVRDLLSRMWSPKCKYRPSSKEVHETLESILRGSSEELYPTSTLDRLFSRDGCLESSPELCSR